MPAPALSQGATQASARSRQISIVRASEEMVLQTILVTVSEGSVLWALGCTVSDF